MAAPRCTAVFLCVLMLVPFSLPAKKNKMAHVLTVEDHKEFKKILRTRTNVLSLFAKSERAAGPILDTYAQVAEDMKGLSTLVFVDCSDKEAKKLCKKVKSNPNTYELKHYKDGDFNKGYDRQETYKSMINFLRDPTGDLPWEEDPTAKDVVHVESDKALNKLVKKEKTPILMMFYAPWCGHCKRLKPDYAAAATELKGQATLAGMDVDKPENEAVRRQFNITGFPTILYFEGGKQKYKYGGENNKQGIVDWMKDPQPPVEKAPEPEWSDVESDVVHLTDETFDTYMEDHGSVLVMFYAPWCGHCKKMKPEYDEAAATLKEENIDGVLAALDATKSPQVAKRFEVKGYPTVKYFKDGEEAFGFNDRTADKIVDFMKDPKEPPPPPPPEQPWQDVESEVVHLGDEDFKSQLKRRKHALVMFYAPWCGHCKKAKPEFTNAAEKYKEDTKVTFAAVDCTLHQGVCGQYEVRGYPTIKYFNYGKNPKDYEGGREEPDFVAFMSDPLNPTPPTPPPKDPAEEWAELEGAAEVVHLHDNTFEDFIQQQSSVLVMFYAPWCGHCKAMKPDYALAAKALKEDEIPGVLAAVDATVDRVLQSKYDITGFPTCEDGEFNTDYNKGRNLDALVEFMKNPQKAPPPPPPEPEWSEVPSEVSHLTEDTFSSFIKEHDSVLVMFYAPWCGHCKKMKPAYQEAAEQLLKENPGAKLAAVDATKYAALGTKYEVRGYPTIKYFKNGEMAFQYNKGRTTDDIVAFMKDPKEEKPPPPEKEWSEEPSDVVHLTDATFATYTQEHSPVLVMFYAPWCGHCKRMKPAFEEAATLLKTEFPAAKLAAVDATQYRDVSSKYEVRGYPTLLYFKNGQKEFKYQLGRSTQELVKFMKNPQAPPPPPPPEQEWSEVPSEINHLTDQTFDSFVYRHSSVLVMFYAPWCGHCKRMKPAYQEAAEQLLKEKPEAKLAAVDATKYKELGQQYGVRGYPTLKYFKNGKVASDYNKGRAKDDIVAFMKSPQVAPPKTEEPPSKEAKPAAGQEDGWETGDVHHLTADSFNTFMQQHHSVLVMFYAPWCGHCKKMKPAYLEAAEQLKKEKPEAKLAAVDATQHGDLASNYGVRGYPTLKYFQDGKEAYNYKKGRTTSDLVSFMKDPQAPPPPPPPEPEWSEVPSEVSHLTEETFSSFMKEHDSVLVMFYAPWCGHCKKMKPAYQEAAETLKTAGPGAKLAAVDCTKYGALAKTYQVRGYPTIKYFRSGEEIQKYQGARDADSIVRFMTKPPTEAPPEWTEGPSAVVTPIKTIPAFDKFVQSHENTLVLFYKKELPKYTQAKGPFMKTAAAFRDDNSKEFAAVDCEAVTDLCMRVGIIPESLPTIKFYVNGKFSTNYKDPVTNVDLYNFMNAAGSVPVKTDNREEL
ncbi:PDIA5 [Branchiostoma lanceolatum]|uniref:protein disulfide-isomerase n=1 Tax=Branchiostoma lanceolatum TaxID=7740 RepID=A0A8J9YTX3_BRALA|nr:PDIA5 [Branchiostoma lanceolatum]